MRTNVSNPHLKVRLCFGRKRTQRILKVLDADGGLIRPLGVVQGICRGRVLTVHDHLPGVREGCGPFYAELKINRCEVRDERGTRYACLSRLAPCCGQRGGAIIPEKRIYPRVVNLVTYAQIVSRQNKVPYSNRGFPATIKINRVFLSFPQYHELFESGVLLLLVGHFFLSLFNLDGARFLILRHSTSSRNIERAVSAPRSPPNGHGIIRPDMWVVALDRDAL
jgi:hypothetical protein